METNKEEKYYFNSKLWDEKGRRLSCFGREKEGKLEIFELTCSLRDSFNRFTSKWVYLCFTDGRFQMQNSEEFKEENWHPKIYTIDMKEGDSARYTFINHCKSNYYKKSERYIKYREEYLIKGNETISLKGTARRSNKMDINY